ncbi:MAG: DNA helicase [Spirochaeta sp. LUC14_002_19_P3]|nr:MAG: DNA helicase [Spirochaeta sp. LUC14_002_19_P3]
MNQDKPLIVQSDGSLLLDVHHSSFEEARGEISAYAELEKSPEHLHTYRLSSLSLWNAASAGWSGGRISTSLRRWSRYEIPESILTWTNDILSRWGKLKLIQNPAPERSDMLLLEVSDPHISEELRNHKSLSTKIIPQGNNFILHLLNRGTVKAALIRLGFPVIDTAPLKDGEALSIELRKVCRNGCALAIRGYQRSAVQAFLGTGEPGTGFGTVVMPCGSGKTVVGMAIMAGLGRRTLILTTNTVAVHQWRDELLDKTDLEEDSIAEYTGSRKQIGSVTIATYQILTWRKDKNSPYPHFDLFRNHPWGLIIYDEVHLLPAPVFRVTAELQSVRRLGLTATLIREDGGESDVFSLVGPKRYDVPWKELEASGWIAEAQCREIRVALPDNLRLPYAMADKRRKIRIAAENPRKIDIAMQLVKNHPEDYILIIGQYISQLEDMAKRLGAPLITGKTPNARREAIYTRFRKGEDRIIVVSKVANFAIDLPDASMAIQLSGAFGSRQEEAQRLGRILRPKQRNSLFCSLVSRGTAEEDFALNRQRFLTEQGYRYTIDLWENE